MLGDLCVSKLNIPSLVYRAHGMLVLLYTEIREVLWTDESPNPQTSTSQQDIPEVRELGKRGAPAGRS